MKAEVEFLQLLILMGYTLTTWTREKWWSTAGCAWWCCVLVVDLFVWQGTRPPYAKEFLNCFDIAVGMVLIYAKYHKPVSHVVKTFLVFMGSMFL